jgi:hypothetical protein
VLAHVLYLRHWDNIAENFEHQFAAELTAGYGAINRAKPTYRGMGRAAVLAEIANFGGAAREGAAVAAYNLLEQYLKKLDPAVIPDNWN